MRVALAADHAGWQIKTELASFARGLGLSPADLGTHGPQPVDYPDFAAALGDAVASGGADRGILICGSGVGASIAANKIHGVRAAVCHDVYSAHQGVEHDDMNVLVLGSRVIGVELAKDVVAAFLKAKFSGEERHRRRLGKLLALERRPAPRDAGPVGTA